jgi:drug/metabolite transporter (DMT)-like permease
VSPAFTLLPVLALLLNAFVWGVSWWPFRRLESMGLHVLWSTALVYLVALLVIACMRPGAIGRVARTPVLWVLMLASGLTNAAFNWGMVAGDVVRVVLLFYLMPLWVVVLARLVLHEPITRRGLLRVVLALVGAFIVLSPGAGEWPWPRSLPDWLGVLGGFSFALNNVMLRRESARPQEDRALAMFFGGVLVAGLMATVFASQGVIAWPPAPDMNWAPLAFVLSGAFLLSNLALQYGTARLSANKTSVVMLSEVVFAAASALLLGGGTLTPSLAIGGGLIVGAAALAAFEPAGS